jgi:hypothetical protein
MPDCLEMPYQPAVRGAQSLPLSAADDAAANHGVVDDADGRGYIYRLGGNSCLSGDFLGSWRFDHQLKVGEYIAADTALKGDQHNYAAILAVLARKEGEIYDSKYENEVLEDRIKMWEGVPVTDVLPVVAFFLTL